MKTEQRIYSQSDNWTIKTNNNLTDKAQIVFVFGDRELLKEQTHIDYLKTQYPIAQIIGCSTSGDIYRNEIFDNHIVCTAVWFEKTTIGIAEEKIYSMEDSYKVGENLAAKLNKNELKHIMIISEGLNVNGSELTKGLNNKLDNQTSITGGLAGDQANFKETVIVHNQAGIKNLVLAIGFYGSNLEVGYGSMGGWESFGVDREVTKSTANILYELDGQPALELYKKYLGSHAANLPASALLFPLKLQIKNTKNSLVRTILSVNETDGSMVFAGDVPQGEYVRLMRASNDGLIDGASEAAEISKVNLTTQDPDFAILISCVGRKLVLKQRVEEELESVYEALGTQTCLAGFYSYGEISPLKPTHKHCELHNQTMTITVFKEN